MRLAGQIKQGFYPIAPAVVKLWAAHLVPEDPARISILDPCCGEGEALEALGEALGAPPDNLYAIELDAGRAERSRARLEGSTVLGPADFFGAKITPTFSVVWLNPPFDDELGGGGREETAFLSRASYVMAPGGILGLVIPESQLTWGLRRQLVEHFVKIVVFEVPKEHRPFGEVLITAQRKQKREDWDDFSIEDRHPIQLADPKWTVPAKEPSKLRPYRFAKGGPTELEILAMLEASPANQLFREPAALVPARPILPLSTGHASLVVASGQVDGLICPPGEDPHVVRGTTRKVNQVVEVEVKESSVTTISREKMVPMVRTISPDGTIRTFE